MASVDRGALLLLYQIKLYKHECTYYQNIMLFLRYIHVNIKPPHDIHLLWFIDVEHRPFYNSPICIFKNNIRLPRTIFLCIYVRTSVYTIISYEFDQK